MATAATPGPRFGARDLDEFDRRLAVLRAHAEPPVAPGVFKVYTDGACLGNPSGPGGWGAVVTRVSGDDAWELWGHLSSTSNNRSEILGVLAALEWVPPGSELELRSDSEYTLKVLGGVYKAKANLDLWTELRRRREAKQVVVRSAWVRGHAGDPGNERADRLAFAGATGMDQPPPPEILLGETEAASTETNLLSGLRPNGAWETEFLQSVGRQLRQGRNLTDRQAAVVERMRHRSGGGEPA